MSGDRAEIQRRAYEIWEREGRPNGREFDHWVAAEAELAQAAQAPEAPPRKPRAPRAKAAPAKLDGSGGTPAPKRTTSRTARKAPATS